MAGNRADSQSEAVLEHLFSLTLFSTCAFLSNPGPWYTVCFKGYQENWYSTYAARCRYNMVNFLPNPQAWGIFYIHVLFQSIRSGLRYLYAILWTVIMFRQSFSGSYVTKGDTSDNATERWIWFNILCQLRKHRMTNGYFYLRDSVRFLWYMLQSSISNPVIWPDVVLKNLDLYSWYVVFCTECLHIFDLHIWVWRTIGCEDLWMRDYQICCLLLHNTMKHNISWPLYVPQTSPQSLAIWYAR